MARSGLLAACILGVAHGVAVPEPNPAPELEKRQAGASTVWSEIVLGLSTSYSLWVFPTSWTLDVAGNYWGYCSAGVTNCNLQTTCLGGTLYYPGGGTSACDPTRPACGTDYLYTTIGAPQALLAYHCYGTNQQHTNTYVMVSPTAAPAQTPVPAPAPATTVINQPTVTQVITSPQVTTEAATAATIPTTSEASQNSAAVSPAAGSSSKGTVSSSSSAGSSSGTALAAGTTQTSKSSSTPIGAIVGGAVGGFAVIAIAVVAVILILHRKKQKQRAVPSDGVAEYKPPTQQNPSYQGGYDPKTASYISTETSSPNPAGVPYQEGAFYRQPAHTYPHPVGSPELEAPNSIPPVHSAYQQQSYGYSHPPHPGYENELPANSTPRPYVSEMNANPPERYRG